MTLYISFIFLLFFPLELLYASSFLAERANTMPVERLDEQISLRARANGFYKRAFTRIRAALERKRPQLFEKLAAGDASALKACMKNDVPLLYYGAAGALGTFSTNPFDIGAARYLRPAILCLQRARELYPSWGEGSIDELYLSVASALPVEFGGGAAEAMEAYRRALAASGGKRASVHVAYALSIALPSGDSTGFKASLEKALAISPDDDPKNRLMTILAQRVAKRLLQDISDFFFDLEAAP